MNLRVMRAAGAKFMYLAHENFPWYNCTPSGEGEQAKQEEAERFEVFLQSVRAEGVRTARIQVFSAHQMGSCRMAPTPATGPTSPSGELFECANLFVADASVFPTSTGINPMVTIEAISHMISKNVLSKLISQHPHLQKQVKDFQAKHSSQW